MRRIFDLRLACHTQQEIADAVGAERRTVADITATFGELGNLAESAKAAASHATDFTPPLYNIWKQQEIADAVGLEQRSVGQVLEKVATLPESLKPAASSTCGWRATPTIQLPKP